MSTLPRALFSALLFLTSALSPASEPAANASTTPPPASEFMALERFLALSDAELAQMADAIARVRALTPAQRAALRDQIAAYRKLPEPERAQIRQGWGGMPAEIQQGWREMMQGTSAEEHAAIQARLQALSPDERIRYRRTLVEAYLKAKAEKR